jgi:monofunctional glycosyltransferase
MLQNQAHKPFYQTGAFYAALFLGLITTFVLAILFSVIALRWVNPSFTSFTLQESWADYDMERFSLREHWIPYDRIPHHLEWAVIASEDQLFWEHRGFDMESIREAWEQRQSGERNRGASTISQQVAKNIYLWPAHSFFRKGLEAGFTILIEFFWPKERILEVYLNIAEFGPGIYGVGKAADSFWGINAADLEPEMSARLAAVLPSPKRMRVNPPSPFAEKRSLWILRQMTHLTGIAYLPEVEALEEDEDLDPMLLEAEFILDSQLGLNGEDPDTISADTLELELPDSLLYSYEPDTFLVKDSVFQNPSVP